jgi:transcriptional regulator with XRE-family HTH domain
MRNRLRQLRIEAGVTQRDLAARAGVSPSTLSRIDATPSASITLELAQRIANALRIDPYDLLPRPKSDQMIAS